MPPIIIGDPAYPLRPWLKEPYINHGNLSTKQDRFNKARIVVGHAFGRLKGRWRCLLNKLHLSVDLTHITIGACCVLNNICQVHGETFQEDWLDQGTSHSDIPQTVVAQPITNTSGEIVHGALTDYVNDN